MRILDRFLVSRYLCSTSLIVCNYPRHNGWRNGCAYAREAGATVRPSIVLRLLVVYVGYCSVVLGLTIAVWDHNAGTGCHLQERSNGLGHLSLLNRFLLTVILSAGRGQYQNRNDRQFPRHFLPFFLSHCVFKCLSATHSPALLLPSSSSLNPLPISQAEKTGKRRNNESEKNPGGVVGNTTR